MRRVPVGGVAAREGPGRAVGARGARDACGPHGAGPARAPVAPVSAVGGRRTSRVGARGSAAGGEPRQARGDAEHGGRARGPCRVTPPAPRPGSCPEAPFDRGDRPPKETARRRDRRPDGR